MLDKLERWSKQLGRGMARGWEAVAEGWRELFSRSASSDGVLTVRLPKATPERRRRLRLH